jgi:IS30 family transposase
MMIDKCAPDVIAGKLKLDKAAETISTESIYRYVYTSPIARKASLYKHLPYKRLQRQERGRRIKRVVIPNRTSIHERPIIANQKKELGHVEIDLTSHKGNQSKGIGVMVDKVTQKVFLILNRSKASLTVTTGFMKKISLIPENLRNTLTMDNGKEFVGHMAYKLMGFKTYFCDAYRPR